MRETNWALSLDALGLRYVALGIPPCSWKEAVMQTGEMCRAVCRMHPEELVIFTDADAEILRKPSMLNDLPPLVDFDIACHWLTPGGRFADPPGSPECLNGTIIVPWPSPKAMEVLDLWCRLNRENPEHRCADQINLGRAIKDTGARVYDLPPEYCWIPDMSEARYGKREPVIVHGQASRKHAGAK